MKQLWAGIVASSAASTIASQGTNQGNDFNQGQIQFYDQDPTGSVDGIYGVEEFKVDDDGNLTSVDGDNLVNCLHGNETQQTQSNPPQTA